MSKIEEYWIIDSSGSQIFKYPSGFKDDVFKFYKDFYIAMQEIGRKLYKNSDSLVNVVTLGEDDYFFLYDDKYHIYFVATTKHNKIKQNLVYERLITIKSLFLSEYKSYLDFLVIRNIEKIDPLMIEEFTEAFTDKIISNMLVGFY